VFADLSFRYKIPLRGAILMWITASVVSLGLLVRAFEDIRTDNRLSAESLAAVLSDALVPEITHDDVWRAFNLVSAPVSAVAATNAVQPDTVVVFDRQRRVFVSSDPARFPILTPLEDAPPVYAAVFEELGRRAQQRRHLIEPDGSSHAFMATPIISDNTEIGTLVLAYPQNNNWERFKRVLFGAGLITGGLVVVMLPFTWYWGAHLADPLVELSQSMRNVHALPDPESIRDNGSRDELGELARAFKQMLRELHEKQMLEQQMVAADRLAAVGRLAAGIAHEINNPLGGMLNVVNTLQRYGRLDDRSQRSLGLIERGLGQIRDTISALLVEAKLSRETLGPQDIEDVRMLAMSQKLKGSATLHWSNALTGMLELPAAQVRQVLLNLLLNALEAVADGGTVSVAVGFRESRLLIDVQNEGDTIPPERLPYLFEPFSSGSSRGTGLGLWVSYQIVQQLGGLIEVESRDGVTRFTVNIPAAERNEETA